MANYLMQVPLDQLKEVRDTYREGRARLTVTPEHATPECKLWLAEIDRAMVTKIEDEVTRRRFSSPLGSAMAQYDAEAGIDYLA